MSMFKEIYQIATTATLAMLISADEKTGRLTISLVPKPKKDSSEAALTKDLTLCPVSAKTSNWTRPGCPRLYRTTVEELNGFG